VRPLGKLLLDLLVDLDVSLERLNLRLHFVVLEEQLLSLLRLILQLSGQLVVLQNSQASGRLQLLVVKSKQVGFGLLDLVKHVLPQFLCRLDLLALLLIHLVDPLLLLVVKPVLVLLQLVSQVDLYLLEMLNVLIFLLKIFKEILHVLGLSPVVLLHSRFFGIYIIVRKKIGVLNDVTRS
jgi:hypothetical protein